MTYSPTDTTNDVAMRLAEYDALEGVAKGAACPADLLAGLVEEGVLDAAGRITPRGLWAVATMADAAEADTVPCEAM